MPKQYAFVAITFLEGNFLIGLFLAYAFELVSLVVLVVGVILVSIITATSLVILHRRSAREMSEAPETTEGGDEEL